ADRPVVAEHLRAICSYPPEQRRHRLVAQGCLAVAICTDAIARLWIEADREWREPDRTCFETGPADRPGRAPGDHRSCLGVRAGGRRYGDDHPRHDDVAVSPAGDPARQ